MVRLSKPRLIEVGVALVLTVAALLFVALTVLAAEATGVEVVDAWARPTIGQGRTTAAYMTITNKGDEDDVLTAVRSAKANSVALHQTLMTADGVMRMREVEGGLPIPAGATLTLAPGKMHLMIMELDGPLAAGSELALILEFAKGVPVEIVVPVRTSVPGGAGHSHH